MEVLLCKNTIRSNGPSTALGITISFNIRVSLKPTTVRALTVMAYEAHVLSNSSPLSELLATVSVEDVFSGIISSCGQSVWST